MYYVGLKPEKSERVFRMLLSLKKLSKHFKHTLIYSCILFARLIDALPSYSNYTMTYIAVTVKSGFFTEVYNFI